jgi:hypothetical protein
MPFAITDAKTLANSWTDETIADDDALLWGNEFIQNEVNSRAWAESTAEFEATANVWYDLPVTTPANGETPAIAGFVRAVEVINSKNVAYSGYTIRNKKIKFTATDTYILTYIGYPAALANITTDVPLQDAFKYPMAKFLLFKQLSVEYDDEDMKPEAERYRQEYLMDLKKAYDEIEMDSENESFQVPMRW